jgi:hypothetical protein
MFSFKNGLLVRRLRFTPGTCKRRKETDQAPLPTPPDGLALSEILRDYDAISLAWMDLRGCSSAGAKCEFVKYLSQRIPRLGEV